MIKLIAKSAFDGALPVAMGECSLIEVIPDAITSVAPFSGQEVAVSAALKARFGNGLPKANRSLSKGGARITWFGPGQMMVVGVDPGPLAGAATSDQSDGWAVMRLTGAGAEAVLARLVPVELRIAVFKRGHTARTLLFHMTASITRVGPDSFEVMVFRSMAGTAVHEISRAMASVAAISGGEAG